MDDTFYMLDTNGILKRSVNGIAEMVVKTVEDNGVIYNVSDNGDRTIIQNILKDGDITYLTNNCGTTGILRLDISSREHRKAFQNTYSNRAERASSFEELKDLYLTVLDVMNYECGIHLQDNGTIHFTYYNNNVSYWLRDKYEDSALYRIITEFTQKMRDRVNNTSFTLPANTENNTQAQLAPWEYAPGEEPKQPQYDIFTAKGMKDLENYFKAQVDYLILHKEQCTFNVVKALYDELYMIGVPDNVTISYGLDEYGTEQCSMWCKNGGYSYNDLMDFNKPSLVWIFATYNRLLGEEDIKRKIKQCSSIESEITPDFWTNLEQDTQITHNSTFTVSELKWLFDKLRTKQFISNMSNTALANEIHKLTGRSEETLRQKFSSVSDLPSKSKERLKNLLNNLLEDLNT